MYYQEEYDADHVYKGLILSNVFSAAQTPGEPFEGQKREVQLQKALHELCRILETRREDQAGTANQSGCASTDGQAGSDYYLAFALININLLVQTGVFSPENARGLFSTAF